MGGVPYSRIMVASIDILFAIILDELYNGCVNYLGKSLSRCNHPFLSYKTMLHKLIIAEIRLKDIKV